MAYVFGEIRAFTGEEVAWMQATMAQVDTRVEKESNDVAWATANPLNWVLGTQRDAMTRAQNLFHKDKSDADQLRASMDDVIESGDTDKYDRWMALAATVTDSSAVSTFDTQIKYSSTAQTAGNVAAATIHDITTPSGWPWYVWAAGALGVLAILGPYVGLLKRRK
jgi:hypothetical protein